MVVIQDRSLRKPSGGRNTSTRTKRVHMSGHKATLPTIGEVRLRTKKTKGGNEKTHLLSANQVNVFDPKTGKHTLAEIKNVKDSSANRNYVRRNILTKNTIIETEKGIAKITNRPGQEKIINAVLIQK
ncbi:MAG: 30S ribosomal protein S8e [Candidatus Woesearchaeota archaeon]